MPSFLVARWLFHKFSLSISIVIEWQATFYFCHLDGSKNEGKNPIVCHKRGCQVLS